MSNRIRNARRSVGFKAPRLRKPVDLPSFASSSVSLFSTLLQIQSDKGPRVIPLPEDTIDPTNSDSDVLDDDDMALLDEHAHGLSFLAGLPKHALDKEVSEARVKKAKVVQRQENNKQSHQRAGSDEDSLPSLEEAGKLSSSSGDDIDIEDSGDDLETYERRPRHQARSYDGSKEKAAPLPIKSLHGDVISRLPPLDGHGTPLPGISGPISGALHIAGVTVQDDLESALAEERKRKKEREAEAAAEAARKAQERAEKARKMVQEEARQREGMLGDIKEYASLEQRREEAKRTMVRTTVLTTEYHTTCVFLTI